MSDKSLFCPEVDCGGPECDCRKPSAHGAKRDMAPVYREALQQAEMDMGVIWMALPPKERETLRIARDRILKVLEVSGGG